MRRALLLFILLFSISAHAEYRAFILTITNSENGVSREVLTTLDHLQYPGYYPVSKSEQVQIKATWRCWERSDGFQPICPNPNASPEGARAPTAGPQTN